MKEQFDQTMSALSPSLNTPPQFPPSPPRVANLLLVAEERVEDKMICWGASTSLDRCGIIAQGLLWSERGDQRGVHQILGEQFGDRRFVAALGEFISLHGGGAAIPKAKKRGQACI